MGWRAARAVQPIALRRGFCARSCSGRCDGWNGVLPILRWTSARWTRSNGGHGARTLLQGRTSPAPLTPNKALATLKVGAPVAPARATLVDKPPRAEPVLVRPTWRRGRPRCGVGAVV